MSLLCSAFYAKCPYYVVLYMQIRLCIAAAVPARGAVEASGEGAAKQEGEEQEAGEQEGELGAEGSAAVGGVDDWVGIHKITCLFVF